ncbi:MAG: hypothetical protein JWQ50_3737 [Caballeronia mineralivorans]|jgi:hypothetical protein|nr:hypothetical protein [Caballeronia mineralivorans]
MLDKAGWEPVGTGVRVICGGTWSEITKMYFFGIV